MVSKLKQRAIRIEERAVLKVEPEFVGVADAEIITGMSRWFWRRAAYDGDVESVKVGSRLLIPLSEIRRVIAEGTRPRVRAGR
jgi:hypothetical protein